MNMRVSVGGGTNASVHTPAMRDDAPITRGGTS
jgi:hypothetical protein